MDTYFSPAVMTIGATVLHSLWQATLLALILWLASRYLKSTPARRYQLAFLTLVTQLLISIATFYFLYEGSGINDADSTANTVQATYYLPMDGLGTTDLTTASWQIPASVYFALAGIWVLGLVFGGFRLLFGHCYTNFFYRRQLENIPAEWQKMVDLLVRQLKFGQRIPQLALSARIGSPALIGLMKPLVLLPVAMVNQLTLEQVEAVLAHELSHLAHRDHWFNFIQSVIEVLFYCNPAVHWISHQVRDEREYRVDDHVARLGIDPLLYAKTLFLLEEQRQLAPTIALAARPGSLLGRVQRLLQNTPNHYRMKPGLLIFLLLLVTTLFSFTQADGPLTETDATPADEAVLLTDLDGQEEHLAAIGLQSSRALNEESRATLKFNNFENAATLTLEKWAGMLIDTTPPPRVMSRQQIVTSSNGREVSIERTNGEITRLEIDGEVIPKENYADYQELMDEHYGPMAPVTPMAPRAPRAPRAPMPPRAPRAPAFPDGEGDTRFYRWEQSTEKDGEATGNNSFFFRFFGNGEDGINLLLPGMDSMLHVQPDVLGNGGIDLPNLKNLLRGNGINEEEILELQEQLKAMTSQMFGFRSLRDEPFFRQDSMGEGFKMLFPGNGGETMEFEFGSDDVFEFHLDRDGDNREIIIDRERVFDSEQDLERLRDRSSSGLFGAGQGGVHRISSDRFMSLAKEFQRRGLIKDEPIQKFAISDSRMKINGKKIDQTVMDRFKREYAAKYRLDWDKDLGEFSIEVE